jgi:hypothetical protein
MVKLFLLTLLFASDFQGVSPLPSNTFGQNGSASRPQIGSFTFANPFLSDQLPLLPTSFQNPQPTPAPSSHYPYFEGFDPFFDPILYDPSPRTPLPSSSPALNDSSPSISIPIPSSSPMTQPIVGRVEDPTANPTDAQGQTPSPTPRESDFPSDFPSAIPSSAPVQKPSSSPSKQTMHPSEAPNEATSDAPVGVPSSLSSDVPSGLPSGLSSNVPSDVPSSYPSTSTPSQTFSPSSSKNPTSVPSQALSSSPSAQPVVLENRVDFLTESPSYSPTAYASLTPTKQTAHPSALPSNNPSSRPSEGLSAAPTSSPSQELSLQPTSNPSVGSTPAPTKGLGTMVSSHEFQWGSSSNGCTYVTPDALLSCEKGGHIFITSEANCVCQALNLDVLRCSPIDSTLDSSVDFRCAGLTTKQLTARGEVLPSKAETCVGLLGETEDASGVQTSSYGGNAVSFAGMGRYCGAPGTEVLENVYPCSIGTAAVDDSGAEYCAAGNECVEDRVCQGLSCTGERSCDTLVDGLIVLDTDSRSECIYYDPEIDLSTALLKRSALVSYHYSEWTYSGAGLGCQGWEVPSVSFYCSNEGEIFLEEDALFCNYEAIDKITCTAPEMNSADTRVSHFLTFWCLGGSATQLELTAEVSASDSQATCGEEGIAIQGLWLARACGTIGTDEFRYETLPSFCEDQTQFYEPGQGMNPLCVAGFVCDQSACSSVDLAAISATSSELDLDMGNCIYAYGGN